MNVLITSASRKVSLVRAFQKALAGEGGGKVIAVDTSPYAAALYVADDHYLVPPSREPEFLGALLTLCRQHDISLIVPTRDEELPLFAENKGRFTSAGVSVTVPDPDAVRACQDKREFVDFCRANGFSTPATYARTDVPEKFPLFVKPRRGKGGQQATRVDSGDELALFLRRMPDAIIQEFVQAPEYTIDLFADFSTTVISVVPRERIRVVAGESFVSRTRKDPLLIQEAVRLSTALRLTGHNTIQCFYEDPLVRFIEVNPRFGGGANLGFAAGAPTPRFLVKLLKGERVEPRIGVFKDRYTMLRYTEDLFLDEVDLSTRASQ